MYGNQEHAYHVRRLGDVARTVDEAYDLLGHIRGEMLDDGLVETQDARNQIRTMRAALGRVLEQLDQTVALLPTPSRDAGLR